MADCILVSDTNTPDLLSHLKGLHMRISIFMLMLIELLIATVWLKFLVRYEFTVDDVTITGIVGSNIAMKKNVVGINLVPRPFGRRKTAGYPRLAHATPFPL